jgi:hypothetical protein
MGLICERQKRAILLPSANVLPRHPALTGCIFVCNFGNIPAFPLLVNAIAAAGNPLGALGALLTPPVPLSPATAPFQNLISVLFGAQPTAEAATLPAISQPLPRAQPSVANHAVAPQTIAEALIRSMLGALADQNVAAPNESLATPPPPGQPSDLAPAPSIPAILTPVSSAISGFGRRPAPPAPSPAPAIPATFQPPEAQSLAAQAGMTTRASNARPPAAPQEPGAPQKIVKSTPQIPAGMTLTTAPGDPALAATSSVPATLVPITFAPIILVPFMEGPQSPPTAPASAPIQNETVGLDVVSPKPSGLAFSARLTPVATSGTEPDLTAASRNADSASPLEWHFELESAPVGSSAPNNPAPQPAVPIPADPVIPTPVPPEPVAPPAASHALSEPLPPAAIVSVPPAATALEPAEPTPVAAKSGRPQPASQAAPSPSSPQASLSRTPPAPQPDTRSAAVESGNAAGDSSRPSEAPLALPAALPDRAGIKPEAFTPVETTRISEPQSLAPLSAPTLPTPSIQDISLRIAQPQASSVDLRVTERAGEIQVFVRTPDPALQTSLRQDLNALTTSLERAGYRADTFVPRALGCSMGSSMSSGMGPVSGEVSAQTSNPEDRHHDPESSSRGASSDSQERRQSQQQRQHNPRDQRAPRWLDELELTR